jgi:hypothetical protein
MKMVFAFLAREVCVREVIKVTGELCSKKINVFVPFRLVGAQRLVIPILNHMEA